MTVGALRALQLAGKAVGFAGTLFLWAAGVFYVCAIAALSVDIVLRYGFNSSIRGLQEGVEIAFIYVFFLGLGALYMRNEDIVMSIVFDRIAEKLKPWATLLIQALIAAVMATVFYQTLLLIWSEKDLRTASLGLPAMLPQLPLAVASATIFFTSLLQIWACLIWAGTGVRPSVVARTGADELQL